MFTAPMATDTTLPHDLRQMVDAELERGERLVWCGRPLPTLLARKALPVVLFGIPWTAFALFWMWGASGFGRGLDRDAGPFSFFFLFGLPFVLIGLGMLSSPYWVARKALRTVYAVTDRRAIIFAAKPLGGMSIRSFAPAALTDLERKQRPDGSGDIVLRRDVSRDSEGHYRRTDVGFLGIANVKEVEALLKDLAASAGT